MGDEERARVKSSKERLKRNQQRIDKFVPREGMLCPVYGRPCASGFITNRDPH